MRRASWFALASLLGIAGCGSTGASLGDGQGGSGGVAGGGDSGGSGGSSGPGPCQECVTGDDCAGQSCAQLGGGSYCAPSCTSDQDCPDGSGCVTASDFAGQQVQVCAPRTDVCGDIESSGGASGAAGSPGTAGSPVGGAGPAGASGGGKGGAAGSKAGGGGGGAGGMSGGSGHTGQAGGSTQCGSLVAPGVTSCCQSCSSGQSCQANGCYGGWWCNRDACKCQKAPALSTCGGDAGSSGAGGSGVAGSGAGGSSASGGAGGFTGSVGPDGGTLDRLGFAVVGDTRPPSKDDINGYPTAIISSIWQRVQGSGVPFAIGTGDYQFSSTTGTQAAQQLDLYLQARSVFTGVLFPALGNHECTGATNSNCGSGNADGVTANYQAFFDKLLAPIQKTTPYYTVTIKGTSGGWTAKLVVVAANAWTSAQASWLDAELAKPTTYTFVVRHEAYYANTAPGVTPSDAIVAKHPYTMLIAGHTHTYQRVSSRRTLIVGNGGAPLTGSVNYGYVLAQQRADGAIVFTARDHATDAVIEQFAVKPDGSEAP